MSEFDRNNVYGAYDEQAGLKAYITKVSVSYTHLDVYKRQQHNLSIVIMEDL